MNFYEWRLRISLAAAEVNKPPSPVTRMHWRSRVSARAQNLWRQLGNAGFRTVAARRRFKRA
jgi:hypothetical protein